MKTRGSGGAVAPLHKISIKITFKYIQLKTLQLHVLIVLLERVTVISERANLFSLLFLRGI